MTLYAMDPPVAQLTIWHDCLLRHHRAIDVLGIPIHDVYGKWMNDSTLLPHLGDDRELTRDKGAFFSFVQFNSTCLYISQLQAWPSPRATPGIRTYLCPGGRVFANFRSGFWIKKISLTLKKKCRNFSICFKETGGSLKSRCSCAVSCQFLQKQQISAVSLRSRATVSLFHKFDVTDSRRWRKEAV